MKHHSLTQEENACYGLIRRLAFPEIFRLKCARAYRSNPEKYKAQARQWAADNPGRRRESFALQRAKRRGNSVADRRGCAKIYARAQWWRSVGFPVAVDHVQPISKGGAHSPENLQIIYKHENMTKGTRLDYVPQIIFS